MAEETETNEGKNVRIGMNLVNTLEELRIVIKKSVGDSIGNNLSILQLSNILADKIKKAGFQFKFP